MLRTWAACLMSIRCLAMSRSSVFTVYTPISLDYVCLNVDRQLLATQHVVVAEKLSYYRAVFAPISTLKRASIEALADSPIPRSLRSLRFFFPLHAQRFCKRLI